MPDLWVDVDAAVIVPVNVLPLLDDTDFKSIETAVVYNSAGLALTWNFVTAAGVVTGTAVTPTTGGVYDWSEPIADKGMYAIEIPASGGASINNDTEGVGWFTGVATGVLPWRGPTIGFRRAALNDLFVDGGTASTNLEDFFDGTGYAGGTIKLAVNLAQILGTALTETAGQLAAAFKKFFDKAAPTGTINSLPDAVAGAASGIAIVGSDVGAATSVTGAVGSVTGSVGSVTGAVGSVTGAVGSVTGAVGSVTAGVTVTTNNDKTGYGLSSAAVQAIWDALTSALVTVGSIGKKLADWVIGTTQTGDSFARLGAPAGASVSADIAEIEAQVDDIVVAGAGLTAIPWNAAWDAEVQSEVDDALVVQRLDELLNADSDIDGVAPPAVGSVVHELLTKTAGSFTYDQTTDSLEAIRDTAPLGTAMRGTDNAALASVCTEARLAELDAANLPTDVVGVKTDTAAILVDTGTTLDGRIPAALSGAGNMKADALAVDGSTTAATNLKQSATVIYVGSVTGAATTTTLIDSALTQAATDFWKGRIIIFLTGTLKFQATDITAFDAALDKLTFTALTEAPAAADQYVIL